MQLQQQRGVAYQSPQASSSQAQQQQQQQAGRSQAQPEHHIDQDQWDLSYW
jgi:hypothetical protein